MKASNKAKAWIVNIVDEKAHDKRKDATERATFIKRELEARKEAVAEKAVWKMLADTDPTAKKLLQELEKLEK